MTDEVTQTDESVLVLKGVRKTFEAENAPVRALRGVDFTMANGDFVAVMGPSGCGKSTMLNLIAGLDKVDEGEITLAGEQIHTMNVDAQKAFSRLADKDRQAVEKAFKSDNVKGSVYKHAETWIDGDGVPRRLIVHLRQELDPEVVFGITYTIDLADFGAPVDIKAPGRDTTADVTTLNALLESVRS